MSVIEDLKRHEGFRATPYLCPEGKLTVGYGINLDAGITKGEADLLLRGRVEKIRNRLRELLWFWPLLNAARQDVLINMAYNLGIDGLLKFKRMLARIADKNWQGAAEEMLSSQWAVQVKGRATELMETMRDGE